MMTNNKSFNVMHFFGERPNRISFKDCMLITKTGRKIPLYKSYIFNKKKQFKCYNYNGKALGYKKGRNIIHGYLIANNSYRDNILEAYMLSYAENYYRFIGYKSGSPFICKRIIFDKKPKTFSNDFIISRFKSYDSNF